MCSKFEGQSFCHQPQILVPAHTLTVICPATTRTRANQYPCLHLSSKSELSLDVPQSVVALSISYELTNTPQVWAH